MQIRYFSCFSKVQIKFESSVRLIPVAAYAHVMPEITITYLLSIKFDKLKLLSKNKSNETAVK